MIRSFGTRYQLGSPSVRKDIVNFAMIKLMGSRNEWDTPTITGGFTHQFCVLK